MNKIIVSMIILVTCVVPTESSDHFFTDNQQTEITTALLPASLYRSFVEHMPICCVDIFVYNTTTDTYLLMLRSQKPAQHCWFYPGGRLCKGESFFACALRKCRQELGIAVTPVTILGCYATVFPDSAWECPTHTVNCAILATTQESDLHFDEQHTDYRWVSSESIPSDPCLLAVYQQAMSYVHINRAQMINLNERR